MATFPRRAKQKREQRHSERVVRRLDRADTFTETPVTLLDTVDKRGSRYLMIVQLLNRDGHCCYLCGERLQASFEIEHIIARKNGGSDHPLNLALACKTCNVRKRDLVVAFTIADRRPFFLLP